MKVEKISLDVSFALEAEISKVEEEVDAAEEAGVVSGFVT